MTENGGKYSTTENQKNHVLLSCWNDYYCFM